MKKSFFSSGPPHRMSPCVLSSYCFLRLAGGDRLYSAEMVLASLFFLTLVPPFASPSVLADKVAWFRFYFFQDSVHCQGARILSFSFFFRYTSQLQAPSFSFLFVESFSGMGLDIFLGRLSDSLGPHFLNVFLMISHKIAATNSALAASSFFFLLSNNTSEIWFSQSMRPSSVDIASFSEPQVVPAKLLISFLQALVRFFFGPSLFFPPLEVFSKYETGCFSKKTSYYALGHLLLSLCQQLVVSLTDPRFCRVFAFLSTVPGVDHAQATSPLRKRKQYCPPMSELYMTLTFFGFFFKTTSFATRASPLR